MSRVFLATLLAGLCVLALVAATRDSALVYTAGVRPVAPLPALAPGALLCQGPIRLPDGARIERARVYVGARSAGPTLELTVRGSRVLGRGTVAGGYRAGRQATPVAARVGGVESAAAVELCVRNAGTVPARLLGDAPTASGATAARLDGEPVPYDLAFRLERERPRALLTLAPAIAERASLFKPRWLGPPALAILALLVLAGVPTLLLVALRTSGG